MRIYQKSQILWTSKKFFKNTELASKRDLVIFFNIKNFQFIFFLQCCKKMKIIYSCSNYAILLAIIQYNLLQFITHRALCRLFDYLFLHMYENIFKTRSLIFFFVCILQHYYSLDVCYFVILLVSIFFFVDHTLELNPRFVLVLTAIKSNTSRKMDLSFTKKIKYNIINAIKSLSPHKLIQKEQYNKTNKFFLNDIELLWSWLRLHSNLYGSISVLFKCYGDHKSWFIYEFLPTF